MRTLILTLTFLLPGLALATPPSSTLTGPTGTLNWTVTDTAEGLHISGRSPRWSLEHDCKKDFTPIRTTRTDAEGKKTTVAYQGSSAAALVDGEKFIHEGPLWEVEIIDVRLGQLAVQGKYKNEFEAFDVATGKVYSFQTRLEGKEKCGAIACIHLRMNLGGALKYVGPKYHYWFAPDGRLVRFEGPKDAFTAKDAK